MGVRRLLAAIATVVVLGLAACGGANDPAGQPPTTTPPEPADTRPVTPEEGDFPADFVKKADPVCAKAVTDIDKTAGGRVQDRATLQKIIKTYDTAAKDLEALKPPEKNATVYKRLTQAFSGGADQFTQIDTQVGHGDTGAYQQVPDSIDTVRTEVQDLANQFGFTQCARAN
jgi:hypothetical protein